MIKFVYFDVGGVVIKDFSGTNKWHELKRSMGITPEREKEFDEVFDMHEPEVCVGKDVEELLPLLQERFDLHFSKDYSFLADFVNRFERNESIWPIIKKARSKYHVGLLTNMYPNMLDLIRQRGLLPEITWDVIIDSSIEKVRKPQAELFQLAQEKVGFGGADILFVENGVKHVEAARAFGWQVMLYDPVDTVSSNRLLEERL